MSVDPPRRWPYYCEENVWRLCADAPPGSRVVFVSNRARSVALCFQRAARDGVGPVVWDYHVLLLVPGPFGWQVVDLDSTLGEPVAASDYLDRTFTGAATLPIEHQPRFRVVDAHRYRRLLQSDRSHMRTPDGAYTAPPPPWPPIGGEVGSNLMRFIDLETPFEGEVMGLEGLRRWLTQGGG